MEDNIKFEELLGKHISITEETLGSDFDNTIFDSDFYIISDELIEKYFYGIRYYTISLVKDENDIVKSISIHFRKVIDIKFYDSFKEIYGEPNSIQIIHKRRIISEDLNPESNFASSLRKSEIDMREGTFDEKPLFIIWKKKDYQIRAFLRHESHISEITFSKK